VPKELKEKEVSPQALGRKPRLVISVIAVGLSLFHVYTGLFGLLPGLQQRSIHLMFALALIFLIYPSSHKTKRKISVLDIISALAIVASCANIAFYAFYTVYGRLLEAYWFDIVLGSILILLILEGTRRIMGWPLPIITVIFIAYAFLGPWIPIPFLSHRGVSLSRFISYEYLTTEGIFTTPLGVSATFVAVFVIFAAFMVSSGVGDWFMDLAKAIAGNRTGGPAKVATISSALFGSISGSAVANVVSTGSVTIPLMKKMGFRPDLSAGVEATASTGGQIMPPMMGAAAFILAAYVGVPYILVCVACFIPAVLYYLSLFLTVHFEASKAGLRGLPKEELPKLKNVLKQGGYLVSPLVVVVGLLVAGYSAVRAGVWGIIAVVLVCAIRKSTRLGFKQIIGALENGAKGILVIAAACACSGIVVGVLTLTGLGLKFAFLLVSIAGGKLFVLLVLAAMLSILLGMGITTSAAYILVAILVAPALTKLGVPPMVAHIFVLYFAVISTITPPVALAAYAAAGIAGSNPFMTGITASRVGIAGFIVPFLLVYNPSLTILSAKVVPLIWALVKACSAILCLSASLSGYLLRKTRICENILLLSSAGLLIPQYTGLNFIGLVILLSVLIKQRFLQRKAKNC